MFWSNLAARPVKRQTNRPKSHEKQAKPAYFRLTRFLKVTIFKIVFYAIYSHEYKAQHIGPILNQHATILELNE
jgi:hypothetical protein